MMRIDKEQAIQSAMQIYRDVLGDGKPHRNIDFVRRFYDAEPPVEWVHVRIAARRLQIQFTHEPEGWVWACLPRGVDQR